MSIKDNVRSKTGEFLSNSLEMFEKIFAQATQQLKIKQKPKPAVEDSLLTPGPERRQPSKQKPAKQPERIVLRPRAPEKIKTSPAAKARPTSKPRRGKGSGVLRGGLLLVLLLVLAGFLASHFAIIDFSAIPDLLGLGPKPDIQAPIPRKQKVKPPQAQEKVATPPPAPSEPTRAVSKEQKLVELETPTTIAQSEQGKEQAQEKLATPSPAPSAQTPPAPLKEEILVQLETPTTNAQPSPAKANVDEKAPSLSTPDAPKAPGVAATQGPPPVSSQGPVPAKSAAPQVPPSKPVTAQYPYSVYLGSFKAPEAVKKALSDYREKGLSAYWSRVDLGDKGVWFRFFAGYFRTKEEAEKYISERNLQGAAPQLTRYANWIGSFGSEKDAEDQRRALVSAGFYPYLIKNAEGKSLLYSGAFDRKEYAEKERSLLASKGFRSDVVER